MSNTSLYRVPEQIFEVIKKDLVSIYVDIIIQKDQKDRCCEIWQSTKK